MSRKTSTHNQQRQERWNQVKGDIATAAAQAGIDPGVLARIANFESGFNTDARPISKTSAKNTVRQFDGRMAISSAHGLGQFLDGTWTDYINKYGKKYGIANAGKLSKAQAAEYRTDVRLQAAMLAEFTRENVELGKKLGGTDDNANTYALHNLGGGDGRKFLNALKTNPSASVNSIGLGKGVVSGNASLYGDGSISVAEAYRRMGRKMAEGDAFANEISGGQATPPPAPLKPVPPSAPPAPLQKAQATRPKVKKFSKKIPRFDSIGHALAFQADQNITGLSDAQTRAYASDTMKTESGGKLDIVNQYGYSGQYQFGAEALVEAGLIDQKKLAAARKGVSKKAWYGGAHQRFLEDSSNWNVAGGMKTFLADKSLQDKAFVSYTNANIARGLKSGAISQGDNAERIAAYAKAAHLKGNGGADALFKHGKVTTDANGTSTKAYAEGAAHSMATLAGQVEQAQHKQNPTASGTPATPGPSATSRAKQTEAVTPATPAAGRPPINTSSASVPSTQPSPTLSPSSQIKPAAGPKPASASQTKTPPKPMASADSTSPPAVDQFAALLGQLQAAISQLTAAAQQLSQPQQITVDVQNGNLTAAVNNANQLNARRS